MGPKRANFTIIWPKIGENGPLFREFEGIWRKIKEMQENKNNCMKMQEYLKIKGNWPSDWKF